MKMSTQETRTARRIWSTLLCLVMLLGLLPAGALAYGTTEQTNLPITKTVEKTGNIIPGQETFTFELLLGGTEDSDANPIYELLDTATITTSGVGGGEYTLVFETPKDIETGIGTDDYYCETIWNDVYLREKAGSDTNWIYSNALYQVNRSIDSFGVPHYTFSLCSEYSTGDPQPSAEFINTYTASGYTIPFTKTVRLGGSTSPGWQPFALEIFNVGSSLTEYGDLYTATVNTYGAGTYEGNLVISGPASAVENLVCEGFFVREVNSGAANWTYSDAVWYVKPETNYETGEQRFTFYPATPVVTDDGNIFYNEDEENPADQMTFDNIYTYTASPVIPSGAAITVKKTDGAGAPLAGAVFALENSRGDAVYTATSNSLGEAQFTNVGSGVYTLVEQAAPEGYVLSDQSYVLSVSGSDVTVGGMPYSPVTFVNRKAATLNREDHYTFLVGYPDGSFGPSRNMTRAEVTAMFARLITEQIEPDKTYINTFNDVPATSWAANYIGFMQQFGIINGYNGSFRPNDPVTRAEFAAIASRFEKLTEGTASFTDVPSTHWAAKYINFAATRGWVTGYEDGTFRPGNPITRAEVATVTCRLLERIADQNYVRSHLQQLRTFTDMTENHWAYWYVMESANGHDYTKTAGGEQWSAIHP